MYPKIRITLSSGPIECELYNDIAPKHAERILTLAALGFYNGILFHRIVPDFVAQAGDPKTRNGLDQPGVGSGRSDLPDLPLEVSQVQKNTRGALAMARSQSPNSANSQFYIVLKDAPHLNMQYTVFGRVLGNGMDLVDKIQVGDAIVTMEAVE